MPNWPILDKASRWLGALPLPFRQIIEDVVPRLLEGFPDTLALAVVGSLAEGTYDEHSDVDSLLVRPSSTGGSDVFRAIRQAHPLTNFIVSTPEGLRRNWSNGSNGAWAVRRSVALYDPNGTLAAYQRTDPPPPQREWVEKYLDVIAGWEVPRALAGQVLALAQLLVGLKSGTMPTTKTTIREGIIANFTQEPLRKAITAATRRGPTSSLASEDRAAMEEGVRVGFDLVRRLLTDPTTP
jgi:hypothetical protein